MTMAKFKEELEKTGYTVFFSSDTDASYNNNSIIVKVYEDNEISATLRADIYISCLENKDFINRLKTVPNLSRIGTIRSNVSYFDNKFIWYQTVSWQYDKNESEILNNKVDTITLT